MRILVDVNLSPRWVGFLAGAGYDAVRWSDVGPSDAEDEVILGWAARGGYTVVTHDQDFGTLLAYTQNGRPSVVLLRTSSLRVGRSGERVLRSLEAARGALEADPGAVLVVEDRRVRVRSLPIG